jgi:putative transposase
MARLPRLECPSLPHLVVQAVLPGQSLTQDAQDSQALHAALLEAARAYGVTVHAYALLPDRFLLLATPSQSGGLSLFMQAVGRRYVAGFNRRHARQGGLWAGRYRATVLQPARYLLEAMAFIELAPWRMGLVGGPVDTSQAVPSSLAHHLGQRTDPLVQDHAVFWTLGNTPFDREAAWKRRLEEGQGAPLVSTLAEAAHTGWALGDVAFLASLQGQFGRRVAPSPRGRPRKLAALQASDTSD